MTVRCSSTRDAVSGILLAGDAVLNLSQQPLNCVADTPFLAIRDGALTLTRTPVTVTWQDGTTKTVTRLNDSGVSRIVVVSDAECGDAARAIAALQAADFPHVLCTLSDDCDADDFMDEADAEAVAERLRQLGYI